jgi:hypothetical protein
MKKPDSFRLSQAARDRIVELVEELVQLELERAQEPADPPQPPPAPPLVPLEIRPDPVEWLRKNWGRLIIGRTRDAAIGQVAAFCRISRSHAAELVASMGAPAVGAGPRTW